jgi:hypothetical protein
MLPPASHVNYLWKQENIWQSAVCVSFTGINYISSPYQLNLLKKKGFLLISSGSNKGKVCYALL